MVGVRVYIALVLHDEARPLVRRPSVLGILSCFSDGMESRIVLRTFLSPLGVIGPNEQFTIVVEFAHKLSPFGVFIKSNAQMVRPHIRCLKTQFGIIGIADDSPWRDEDMLSLAIDPFPGKIIKFAAIIVLYGRTRHCAMQ